MTSSQGRYDRASTPVALPSPAASPRRAGTPAAPQTRYAPDAAAIAADVHITDADVLAVIDARGGRTYGASVDTGLANRFPFVDPAERKKAVARALNSGAVVCTPMGVFRRPPGDDD